MPKSKQRLKILPRVLLKTKTSDDNYLCVWQRSARIPNFLVGELVKVYNGREFKIIRLTKERIGFKFGEFVPTRKPYVYKGKKKIIKKKLK